MLVVFLISLLFVTAFNLIIAYKVFSHKTTIGWYFSTVGLHAAIVAISYGVSILCRGIIAVSVASSVYFMAIDWLLVTLFRYVLTITTGFSRNWEKKLIRICGYVAGVESLIFMINPFAEISMKYVSNGNPFACYSYDPQPLYYFHLAFTYLVVFAVLALFIYKTLSVPKVYRVPYTSVVVAIILIVIVNAVFLYMPKTNPYSNLDWSIMGYSIAIFLVYWGQYFYNKQGLLNKLRTDVYESLDQGLVLYDYEEKIALCNQKAYEMFPNLSETENTNLEAFLGMCGLKEKTNLQEDVFSMQCFTGSDENTRPLRCDYRHLFDQKKETIGRLFVFTDISMETDILTGFQNWEGFKRFVKEHPEQGLDCIVVACDINGLSAYNQLHGKEAGDKLVAKLATMMRSVFPSTTYLVRELDANLIALVHDVDWDTKRVATVLEEMHDSFEWDFQYSFIKHVEGKVPVELSIKEAIRGMRSKKLLDQKSSHSENLTALVRALKESDSETEAHVLRTQKMGKKLGQRLGLSDIQLTDLSLLCILHDIGKIGVPLEILNKQSKLTDEEWQVVQGHVEKGYQIAKSSKDFFGIADCIRYHHERWDGKGYPTGISRESIPILSRIISVVDSYDAMTNDRPYRKRIPEGVARKELLQGAGTQFDPHIVAEFMQMLEESDTEQVEIPANYDSKDMPTSERVTVQAKPTENVHEVKYSRYLLNNEMTVISVDEYFEEITGYSKEDVDSGKLSQTILLPEEDRAEYFVDVEKQLAAKQIAYFEHRLQRKDGTIIYVFCYGRYYYDSAVKEMRSEVIIANLAHTHTLQLMTSSQENLAQARLERWENQYRRDSMTGLFNHAAFQNDVEAKLLEQKYLVVMLMLDADHFKQYNDTFGHHAGDEFLIYLAQTLKDSLRSRDLCSRMGGDEFSAALFFDKNTSMEIVRTRIHQIFDNLTICVKKFDENLGVSMGAAVTGDTINTFRELYQMADQALYRSKEEGRGRLTIQE